MNPGISNSTRRVGPILPHYLKIGATTFVLVMIMMSYSLPLPGSDHIFQRAYADGLTREEFFASVGNRDMRLSVQINPPVLTSESVQDAFMQFRLFNANNNETVKFTTYHITVRKGIDNAAKPIVSDFFHSESGLLTLKIQPSDGPVTIYGTREDFLKAWKADPGGTINVKGPLLLEGGIYHFQIEIFGIDSIRNIFSPDDAPGFDSWLSVGDISRTDFEYNGQTYNTTVISYYDKVNNFKFDADKKTFTWSMPFDWNIDRLKDTSLFVHEEIRIPRSLAGIGDANAFTATLNGDPLDRRMITIDPYTSESELILHYLLNKNDILGMAEKVQNETAGMSFSLTPAADTNVQTTAEMVTDTGGINVAARWAPNQLSSGVESTVKLDFSDAFSGDKISSDVLYDLRILDNNGNEVYSKTGLTAKGGTDIQKIDFPSDERYGIEVTVQGLVQDGRPVDETRNGIARGVVIVPEFPTGALGIVVAAMATMAVVLSRRFNTRLQA